MVIIQSKTRNEAIARLGTIKNVLDYGSAFRRMFGYGGEEVADVWREDRIKTKIGGNTITIRAIGTGQPMRGALESGIEENEQQDTEITDTRITLYFLEDPDDEDNTATEERMDKNWSKFLGSKEGLDKRNGRVLVIGTPITRGCIVDKIHSNPIGWVSKIYQAEWKDDDGKEHYLWKEMRDAEWLANKKAELVAAGKLSKYYSEYLCQLKKGEDVFFKGYHTYKGDVFWEDELAFLKVTRIDGLDLPEPKIIPINTFVGIDPASSVAKGACFSVTFPMGYTVNDEWFTLPYFRQRVEPLTHAEQIISAIKTYKFKYGSVETVNYQIFLRDYLRRRMFQEGLYVAGLERKWNPHVDKDERLISMQPEFATGKMYILEGQHELIDEMEMFPDGSKDLLDGMYYSTRKKIKPDHMHEDDNKIKYDFQELRLEMEDMAINNNKLNWMLN